MLFFVSCSNYRHSDHLEEVLQLLSGRTQDAEAKDFMTMYWKHL